MFVWKPLYPNNMPCNGIEGYYSLVKLGDSISKYTILFQYEMNEDQLINKSKGIEHYILFVKRYTNIIGPKEYPEPSDNFEIIQKNKNTFTPYSVNDYGTFLRAFHTMEEAKKHAMFNHSMIKGIMDTYFKNN